MMYHNQLDLLNQRQINYLPPHFSIFRLDNKDQLFNKENILNWVRLKLQGRFSMLKSVSLDSDQKVKSTLTIGFENPSELTYFMIACPFLRRT